MIYTPFLAVATYVWVIAIVLVVMIAVMAVLYFLGRKAEKKQL